MESFNNAIDISVFLNQFYKELNSVVESLTHNIYESDLMPELIVDDYIRGENSKRIKEDELYKLRNDLDKIKDIVPVLPEYKSDFSNTIEEILMLSINYTEKYKSTIESKLKKLIQYEKQEYQQFPIINTTDFINNNPFKKLFSICQTLVETLKDCNFKNKSLNLSGFDNCKIPQEKVREIYNSLINHKPNPQIKGREQDFLNIFSSKLTNVEEPIEWCIKHGNKANNRAFHTFLRLMLDNRYSELSRDTVKKANKLFTCNNKPIYPNDKIKYPGKGNEQWMKSSIVKHFSKISYLIEKQDQK